jgi:hypothetical protein
MAKGGILQMPLRTCIRSAKEWSPACLNVSQISGCNSSRTFDFTDTFPVSARQDPSAIQIEPALVKQLITAGVAPTQPHDTTLDTSMPLPAARALGPLYVGSISLNSIVRDVLLRGIVRHVLLSEIGCPILLSRIVRSFVGRC